MEKLHCLVDLSLRGLTAASFLYIIDTAIKLFEISESR